MGAIHFMVSGRVQGVWFRASTRSEAERLGLVGWVRNLPDGRVEGWAEGNQTQLDALVDFLKVGPERARVDDLAVKPVEARGEKGFHVR